MPDGPTQQEGAPEKLTVQATLHFRIQGKYNLNISQLVDAESFVSPFFMRERHYWVGPNGSLEATVKRTHEWELVLGLAVIYVGGKVLDGFLEKLGANLADFVTRQFGNPNRQVSKTSIVVDGKETSVTADSSLSGARVSVTKALGGRRDRIEIEITVEGE